MLTTTTAMNIILVLAVTCTRVLSGANNPSSPIMMGVRFGIQSALAKRSRRPGHRFAVSALGRTSNDVDQTQTAFLRTSHPSPLVHKDEASLLLGDEDKHQPLTRPSVRRNDRTLNFFETMICGAVSRTVAQTVMHPFNTMKTILQNESSARLVHLIRPQNWVMLTRGAGAQAILSVPHGAINFAVIEVVRARLAAMTFDSKWSPGLDFVSSCIATVTCSVVSTPQMMICDNIMAGNYANLAAATRGLAAKGGFYAGWWPGLAGKIPSYALTWTLFQQLKRAHHTFVNNRPAKDWENSAMGCFASAASVSVMIPLDTIKSRLVTQVGRAGSEKVYKGIIDCAVKTFQAEGIGAFYRGLPPRLVSVVPMIGIQFGVYEAMKRIMHRRQADNVVVELTEPFP